jgi:rhodanese-related sulfurtransferase
MSSKPQSLVLAYPVPDQAAAMAHLDEKLAMTTDCADVYHDLENRVDGIVVVDARSAEAFARAHIPGAISFPHRTMNAQTTASLDRSKTYVVYCDGIGCNGSIHGTRKLTALGFKAKEMLGGIDWWHRFEGYALHTAATQEPALAAVKCGC